ncbi:alpha-amylase family glycosyl hydrolase [Brachybacterium sp. Z12]|uniref:alpha-amylase family glycosyl hydrolase n=1 Tax=Brachybacterium sp. Z12 TaxID=2759167 RepID=UPI00223AAA73|nr:alpha-amylase family glycosyl hydrolase [Brachybacterium sp. Z12]
MPSGGATSENGRGDAILNLFQWTWDSVAAECTSTIGPAGFGYVQVSPPQETIQGTAWWTSYQPVSYKIEGKLGTRAEFAAMVETCDAAGVEVIVDAVINHTTGADGGSGTGTAGTPTASTTSPASTAPPTSTTAARTSAATRIGTRCRTAAWCPCRTSAPAPSTCRTPSPDI